MGYLYGIQFRTPKSVNKVDHKRQALPCPWGERPCEIQQPLGPCRVRGCCTEPQLRARCRRGGIALEADPCDTAAHSGEAQAQTGGKTKGGTKGIYFIFHRNIHNLGIPRHGATEPYCNPQKPKPYSPRPTTASPITLSPEPETIPS